MDSLTQIVLGAAVGEAVAGKKIGNKAMVWGAIAGTIPDLDVFVGGILGWSEIQSLAFHRGISHSFLFAFLAPFVLAMYTYWFYGNEKHKLKSVKISTAVTAILGLIAVGAIPVFLMYEIVGKLNVTALIISIIAVVLFSTLVINSLVLKSRTDAHMPFGRWYLFFFLTIFTHPILDSCTGYGTQLFQPFSDIRVAWSNISVADPLYTFPFLLFLVLAAFFPKHNKWRTILNYTGIIYSLIYLAWTVRNKLIVNNVFTDSLDKKEISFERYSTGPTILNNVLWHCIAEGDSVYYDGLYSLLDSEKTVKITEIKKNHELLDYDEDDEVINTMKWFTAGYYNVFELEGDTIQFNDLRYGPNIDADGNKPSDYLSSMLMYKDSKTGKYELKGRGGPPEGSVEEFWNALISRIKGR